MARKIEINMNPEGYEQKKRFMSDPEIARFFGVSLTVIKRWKKENGISPKQKEGSN